MLRRMYACKSAISCESIALIAANVPQSEQRMWRHTSYFISKCSLSLRPILLVRVTVLHYLLPHPCVVLRIQYEFIGCALLYSSCVSCNIHFVCLVMLSMWPVTFIMCAWSYSLCVLRHIRNVCLVVFIMN